MPKVSIVSTYYNRKLELWRTLKTIEKSSFKDLEYIIVDDGSDPEHRIEGFLDTFSFLKLKRIEPQDKYYYNPCVPYNMAIAMAQGDIVILQSPECMYIGDPIQYAIDNIVYEQYFVYSCYSLGQNNSLNLSNIDIELPMDSLEESITMAIGGFTAESCDRIGRYDSWFTHPVYRAIPYNFLSAMTMKDLRELGGFDERFAEGHAFDDTDFLARIRKKKMKVNIVEKPYCIHQFHPSVLNDIPDFWGRERRNRMLYEQLYSQPHYYVKNSFLKEN
jgi:glycosyltransferase involved in cell wall biosynthesis